jgi:hypothetical protein
MIIHDFHVMGIAILETKTNTPAIVHRHRHRDRRIMMAIPKARHLNVAAPSMNGQQIPPPEDCLTPACQIQDRHSATSGDRHPNTGVEDSNVPSQRLKFMRNLQPMMKPNTTLDS